MGLAIVDEIARAHGASLAFDSPPGQGLMVTVTFPRPKPCSPAAGPAK
ncbi:hypothetical protein [Billgrantia tianxiuensis]